MKFANKIISTVIFSLLLVSVISCFYFYAESKNASQTAGEEKAAIIIETFDLMLTGSENAQDLQTQLNKIKESEMEIVSFNISDLESSPKIIASLNPEEVGKAADSIEINAVKENEIISSKSGHIVEVASPLHKNGKVSYSAKLQFDITDELEDSNQLLVSIIIITSSIIVLVSLGFWLLLSRFFTRPLNMLVGFSRNLAEGNLKVDIKALNNNRKDEIGQLSAAFYQMFGNLRLSLQHISHSSSQLSSQSEMFTNIATTTKENEQANSKAVTEIALSSKTQVSAIHESSLAMEEVAKGTVQISESIEEVAEASSSTLRQAEQGRQIIAETETIIEQLALDSKESVQTIQALGQKTKDIDGIIVLIAQIATQTNLLSLNASIEAARAGEHGRGFAVVANEVKKLAERSKEATTIVSDMIQAIHTDTESVVQQINTNWVNTEEGLAAVREAGVSFQTITEQIDTVNSQIINVSSIVEEISSSSEQVAATIQSLAGNVELSSKNAEQVEVSIIESLNSMEQLLSSTTEMNQLSSSLAQLASRFKF
jgi:methyl-accepting chemotaxis protein